MLGKFSFFELFYIRLRFFEAHENLSVWITFKLSIQRTAPEALCGEALTAQKSCESHRCIALTFAHEHVMFVRAFGRLRFCPHRRHLLHVSLCFLLHIRLARMRTPWLK